MTSAAPVFSDPFGRYARNIVHDIQKKFDQKNPNNEPQDPPPPPVPVTKVGIIGGGVGGLYAAMMLQSVGIPYEILEAQDHVGGRLFTYNFDPADPTAYFDVGAMRFPQTPMMGRTFRLFDILSEKTSFGTDTYNFKDSNTILLYNETRLQNTDATALLPDPFSFPDIPDNYKSYSAKVLVDYVVRPFVVALAADLELNLTAGWELMMKYDKFSTRGYMLEPPTQPALLDPKGLLPFPPAVIDWLETRDKSDGWYDNAFTETVLEQMAFAYPGKENAPWFLVKGGAQNIANSMKSYLDAQGGQGTVTYNARVRSMTLRDSDPAATDIAVEVYGDTNLHSYSHVITTTTLSALNLIDTRNCGVSVPQKMAMRELQYGPASKIGVQFQTAWWKDPANTPYGAINGGQSFTDRPMRTIVYPSYDTTVLIVSYAWTDDAERLTGLMNSNDPKASAVLQDIIVRDLVDVHGLDPVKGADFLNNQIIKVFPWSWLNSPYTMGAYAFFEPGQFSLAYKYLTMSAAKNRLFFAGEVLSARHAWVVGALDASWLAVYSIISTNRNDLLDQFTEMWGKNEEWPEKIVRKHLAIGRANLEHRL